MPQATLKINDEYHNFLPPLPLAEYEALKNSIRENGLYVPITANPEGFILDGHNRYDICIELGVEAKYEVKTFEDPLLEKKFVIESNLTRRHLTTFQRIEMALPLIELEKELAEKRRLSTLKEGDELPDRQNFAYRGKSLEIVAERIGVSYELLRQALYLMEHTSEEDLAKLRSGERAISNLYKQLKHSIEKQKGEDSMHRFLARLLQPPKRKDALKINKYGNARFALVTLERSFFDEFERDSLELEVPAELSAMKALEEYHTKIKRGIALKKVQISGPPKGVELASY